MDKNIRQQTRTEILVMLIVAIISSVCLAFTFIFSLESLSAKQTDTSFAEIIFLLIMLIVTLNLKSKE